MASPALSLTLYEHTEELIHLASAIAEAPTPEEAAELQPLLAGAIAGTRAKVDRCAQALAMLDSFQSAAREEAARLSARALRMEKAEETLRAYMLAVLDAANLSRIEGHTSTIRRQANPPRVHVFAPGEVPADCWIQPPPPPPVLDRIEISKRIKADVSVPGCQLERGYHLRVS